MNDSFWLKQDKSKPLFPEVVWSRPVNRLSAGKILIIGGSSSSFKNVSALYNEVIKAGAGEVMVAMPDSLAKLLAGQFKDAVFLSSSSTGSLARQALAELLHLSEWSDAVILGGDLSKNSEVSVLLASFINKYSGLLAVTNDSLESLSQENLILNRANTIVCCSTSEMQKLFHSANFHMAITHNMGLVHLVERLHEFTKTYKLAIVSYYEAKSITAYNGQVATTAWEGQADWQTTFVAKATVAALNYRPDLMKALTSSLIED